MRRKEYPIKDFLMITNEESDDRDTQGDEDLGEGGGADMINCEKTIHACLT